MDFLKSDCAFHIQDQIIGDERVSRLFANMIPHLSNFAFVFGVGNPEKLVRFDRLGLFLGIWHGNQLGSQVRSEDRCQTLIFVLKTLTVAHWHLNFCETTNELGDWKNLLVEDLAIAFWQLLPTAIPDCDFVSSEKCQCTLTSKNNSLLSLPTCHTDLLRSEPFRLFVVDFELNLRDRMFKTSHGWKFWTANLILAKYCQIPRECAQTPRRLLLQCGQKISKTRLPRTTPNL